MAETDLSKIVGLIMENPRLVEEIRSLANGVKGDSSEKVETPSVELPESKGTETVSSSTYVSGESDPKHRRKDLLLALKPYVSEERGRAIESMMSIADILEMMRSR